MIKKIVILLMCLCALISCSSDIPNDNSSGKPEINIIPESLRDLMRHYITNNSVEICWAIYNRNTGVILTDPVEFKVVYSLSGNIITVSKAETNGILVHDWGTGGINYNSMWVGDWFVCYITISGLSSGTQYYANVIVRDTSGNKSVYNMISFTTL